jgi:hypothetical protein
MMTGDLSRDGSLTEDLPLYQYLAGTLAMARHEAAGRPVFEFTRLNPDRPVFLCREARSGTQIVCKFFAGRPNLPASQALHLMNHEFHCLQWIRAAGLDHGLFRAVRPLGRNASLGCVLIEDFAPGNDLDHYLRGAAQAGEHDRLLDTLDLLAAFFACLHRATHRKSAQPFARACNELRAILRSLAPWDDILADAIQHLAHLCDKWEGMRGMWTDSASLVHGDATPTNFLFPPVGGITAVDLERAHLDDPAYDLGFVVAELKHHFALRIREADAAERFISHFLHRYSTYAGLGWAPFTRLTQRSRFYMALGEVRIARHPWLPSGHKQWLVQEACRCLRG